jgi:hypothetical protein
MTPAAFSAMLRSRFVQLGDEFTDGAGGQTPLWSETRVLELDPPSIKSAPGMGLAPCKTPAMVRKQVRMTLLFRPSSSDSELPMTSTNGTYPPDGDDIPKLPEGILEKALAGSSDPRKNSELLELIQCVLPYAIKLIRESFDVTKPRREKAPTTRQMRELREAQHVSLLNGHPDDADPEVRAEIAGRAREAIDQAIEAALRSAAGSFLGHWIKEFSEVRGAHDLALHLIRITYNRYQRRRRDDARLGRQVKSGVGALREGSFLESRAVEHSNPASEAEFRDFLEIHRRLTDGVLEGFSTRDRQIILLYVTGYEPKEIVVLINRLGRKGSPCTLSTVHHVIKMFKAQLGRLEDEDEPGRTG